MTSNLIFTSFCLFSVSYYAGLSSCAERRSPVAWSLSRSLSLGMLSYCCGGGMREYSPDVRSPPVVFSYWMCSGPGVPVHMSVFMFRLLRAAVQGRVGHVRIRSKKVLGDLFLLWARRLPVVCLALLTRRRSRYN